MTTCAPTIRSSLIADIVALLPGNRVVEIGAGTGKATAALIAAGLVVTCVEPDPAMAAMLATRPAASRSPPPLRAGSPPTPTTGWSARKPGTGPIRRPASTGRPACSAEAV